jgi:formylglycine-generating enzyme required for sulfatase activity
MGDNPSRFKYCGDDCPAESVSWEDAQEFISKLNQMEGINKYRLPTEAEWEYACRAETKTQFFNGDCISIDQANYDGSNLGKNCPKGEYRGKTIKAGSFQPNAWGLYDMHGNVSEWVQDWYGIIPLIQHPIQKDLMKENTGCFAVVRGSTIRRTHDQRIALGAILTHATKL